jgi:hypothetical protein
MSLAGHHVCRHPEQETLVQGCRSVQTDLYVRVLDGSDKHDVALHHLSPVDDLASTSAADTGVIRRLYPAVPDVPFSAAGIDGAHLSTDQARDDDTVALRRSPHDKVTAARARTHIGSWSREDDLREETRAEYATITTWVLLAVPTNGIDILPLGQDRRAQDIETD